MLNNALVLAPLIAMVFGGYCAGRLGWFPEAAAKGLHLFVFRFAMPVMLVRSMATVTLPSDPTWNLWFAYFGGTLISFAISALLAWHVFGMSSRGMATFGMTTGFSNIVVIGIPFHLQTLGPNAAVPLFALIALHSPLLLTGATLFAELRGGRSVVGILLETAREAYRNPILMAIIIGLIYNLSGLPFPDWLFEMSGEFTQAALPCAAFSMGATLAALKFEGTISKMACLIGIKMLFHPIAVGVLALWVFDLTRLEASVAILSAVLPTGVNAYLFAHHYDESVRSVSSTILITTLLSMPVYAIVAGLVV